MITEQICLKSKFGMIEIETIQDKIEDYNNTVNGLNFDKPFSLYGYCIYNSQIIGIREENSYLKEHIIYDPNTALEILLLQNIDTVEQKVDEFRKQQKVLLDELKSVLMDNREFHQLTNQTKRNEFSRTFLNKPEYQKYTMAFDNTSRTPSLKYFIDSTYQEYKESINRR